MFVEGSRLVYRRTPAASAATYFRQNVCAFIRSLEKKEKLELELTVLA